MFPSPTGGGETPQGIIACVRGSKPPAARAAPSIRARRAPMGGRRWWHIQFWVRARGLGAIFVRGGPALRRPPGGAQRGAPGRGAGRWAAAGSESALAGGQARGARRRVLKGTCLGPATARPGPRRGDLRGGAASWGLVDGSGPIIGGAARRARLLARGSGRAGEMPPKLDMRAAIRFIGPRPRSGRRGFAGAFEGLLSGGRRRAARAAARQLSARRSQLGAR